MAQRIRMSAGDFVSIYHKEVWDIPTEISNGYDIKHTPYEIRRFALQLTAYLPSCPRVRPITPNHIFRLYTLHFPLMILTLANQILRIVFSKITSKQPILYILPPLLCGHCLFLAQMSQLYRYGIRIRIFHQRFIDVEGFGKDATRHFDIAVLFDVIEEETFDAALVEDYLLESR